MQLHVCNAAPAWWCQYDGNEYSWLNGHPVVMLQLIHLLQGVTICTVEKWQCISVTLQELADAGGCTSGPLPMVQMLTQPLHDVQITAASWIVAHASDVVCYYNCMLRSGCSMVTDGLGCHQLSPLWCVVRRIRLQYCNKCSIVVVSRKKRTDKEKCVSRRLLFTSDCTSLSPSTDCSSCLGHESKDLFSHSLLCIPSSPLWSRRHFLWSR